MIKWWLNLSVSKKLYGVVGIMALLIAMELFTLYFAMTTLSAVRAFVGGEGLWSKAQKTAVYHLQQYAMTRDEKFYQLFQNELRIPLGDHKARIELSKADFDMRIVTAGFLEGENHPDDIPPMINLVRRFYQIPHLANAIDKWTIGDALIMQLIEKGKELQKVIQASPKNDSRKINETLIQIFSLDNQLTKAENEFSYSLGEASRWLEGLLMVMLIIAVVTVEGTGLFLTVSFARTLTKNLNDMNQAAILVGQGDFSQTVPVRSRDELGQLAESLNKMTSNLQRQTNERHNAEQASETKNLFLANMSHEIRTPLNAILGFSEVLSDPHISEQERSRYAAIIQRTGTSLTSIINDILDVSKVEAGHLEIEPKDFSLPQLISDINTVLRLRCEPKGLQLNFNQIGEISDLIQSDPARLRQILINTIGNSIKFTHHGSVDVTYEVVGPYLTFTIKDTGPGVPKDQVERLFKPFSQGDDSIRKKYGGTGLGLLISRRLAQLLGGDVVLKESVPQKGSTFLVRIAYVPVAASSAEDARPSFDVSKHAELDGKNILVVEDSLDNQLLAQVYLKRTGAHVEFASNGREGVDKIINQHFDLVLMDIQMPIMDGYTATKELRRRGYDLPIIALTGYAMKQDQVRCIEAGCNDYISKPFARQTLLECISKYIH